MLRGVTFGSGDVKVLPTSTSNHCPILLSLSQNNNEAIKLTRVRRYEDKWSSFSDCEDVIKKKKGMGKREGSGCWNGKNKRKVRGLYEGLKEVELQKRIRGNR